MRGFTLIEVLVALAIVAVALLAAVRAAGAMSQANAELRLRLLAQLAADNRIAELRAAGAFPPLGTRTPRRRDALASTSGPDRSGCRSPSRSPMWF